LLNLCYENIYFFIRFIYNYHEQANFLIKDLIAMFEKYWWIIGLMLIPLIMGTASFFNVSIFFSNVNSGGNSFSFVHITDLHIGEGIEDYGSAGFDDLPPDGDVGASAQRLREIVNWINSNINTYHLSFVMITGDITDSGERSEFCKAKEILDALTIPYVPLIGNHDIWPYTSNTKADTPCGDRYFMEIFSDTFEGLKKRLTEWNDETRLTRIWNPKNNCISYFQNYTFNYRGYHFICADFNSRSPALLGGKGVSPEADLHDFSGGTWSWFEAHYHAYQDKGAGNMMVFAHHPLRKSIYNVIYSYSYNTVAGFLNDNDYKYNTGLWCAGHLHRNSAYDVKNFNFNPICSGIETGACKDGYLRVITVWGAK